MAYKSQTSEPSEPVQGWFIPAQPTEPAKPQTSLLTRLALVGAVILAVVLSSHTDADDQDTTPPQTPAPTTTGTTP
ncbi:hypothetical protein ABZ626_36820 [Streptomyces longispororuber]|uniref:hypothetical protein n=1 Tax=Streptomyces longispororuber TaxID=68230 RepID=UPI0033D19911